MNISILGAGRVGSHLARALVEQHHTVTLGCRDPDAARARWQGPAVDHATLVEAAGRSPFVIHATPGATALDTLTALRTPLDGKVLLDVSNAVERLPNGMPGPLCYPNGSLAEQLQAALPGTRVVKSLNTMLFSVMTAPRSLGMPPTAFVSGNDADAKAQVIVLLAQLGWPRDWVLDLGAIETARATEPLVLLGPAYLKVAGMRPFAVGIAR